MNKKESQRAEIAIIGGSGFYDLLKDAEELEIKTPYGLPSDKITLGIYQRRKIAFLPRHGKKHQYPPHKIPYQANLVALNQLGVKTVIAPAAVGSLKADISRGTFVICDEFIDRTSARKDTFYDGPRVVHISSVSPYCPQLRSLAIAKAREQKIPVVEQGTVVVIQGPRFSSRAESKWFSGQGWDVINMTQYPEVVLARELGMCYVNISLVTDYDAGLVGENISPVTAKEVARIFQENNRQVKKLIFAMIPEIPSDKNCDCQNILTEAEI